MLENQHLQHENKNLNALLKEYESTLEQVMGKFRGIAVCVHMYMRTRHYSADKQHASQQHDLSLHSYYSSLLQTLQTAHSSAHLHDDTSLSLLLNRLSTLLRSALRSLGGEDPDTDLANLLNNSRLTDGSSNDGTSDGPPSPAQSTSSAVKSSSSGRKPIVVPGKPTARQPPFPGFLPGASGGYAGTEGQADWALEREMEIQRLEEENKILRDLLSIAEESPAALAVGDDTKDGTHSGPQSPPLEEGSQRRKGSLTVEELEAGAELEAEEKKRAMERAIERGVIDQDGNFLMDHQNQVRREPGTGLGGGGGVAEGGTQRPVLHDSALGFTAEVASGSAIDDGDGDHEEEKEDETVGEKD